MKKLALVLLLTMLQASSALASDVRALYCVENGGSRDKDRIAVVVDNHPRIAGAFELNVYRTSPANDPKGKYTYPLIATGVLDEGFNGRLSLATYYYLGAEKFGDHKGSMKISKCVMTCKDGPDGWFALYDETGRGGPVLLDCVALPDEQEKRGFYPSNKPKPVFPSSARPRAPWPSTPLPP